MVVYGDRKRSFSLILADDVVVQLLLDLRRLWQILVQVHRLLLHVLYQDFVAELDALVADVHARAGDDLFDLIGPLSAKRAADLCFG